MIDSDQALTIAFASAMAELGPFETRPALAVAVSGGADSMALAILARNWTRRCGGSTVALVVDHGLRPASASEARVTLDRLARLGIAARLLQLSNLGHGAALAERARIMRYQMLTATCREAGILHLLLGHHAADQVETLAMRVLRGSQTRGLACMSALVESAYLRLLRPLLGIEPAQLRDFLIRSGLGWVEDPSNQDTRALRPRLRRQLARNGEATAILSPAVTRIALHRCKEELGNAAESARRATVRPEGFAVLSSDRVEAAVLSSLIRTISGGQYPPNPAAVHEWLMQPRPCSLAGVCLRRAGRLGCGWLITREEAAIEASVSAVPGVIWDHRFRFVVFRQVPAGAIISQLGDDASKFRKHSDLPSTILRTLPALRIGKVLAAVPHVRYASTDDYRQMTMVFFPSTPAAGACFMPIPQAVR